MVVMDFSKEDVLLLQRHVSNIDKNIYVIYNLPPEVIAVLFAYVSRNPASFRENLLKLIKSQDLDFNELAKVYVEKGFDYAEAKEKAKKFHEKWVVGYGHSSIAEHAVASIAVEDVSILASKAIEDCRIASYTEKSTRYQIFERNRFYKPPNVVHSQVGEVYQKTCESLFDLYHEMIPKLIEYMKETYPKEDGMSDAFYESISKARACDVARYVLPVSTLTNLAITINARSLERMITKLLSHPLSEMQEIGKEIKTEVSKIIPTLVKYTEPNLYLIETNRLMKGFLNGLGLELVEDGKMIERKNKVALVSFDKEAENKIIASIIYKYSNKSYDSVLEYVKRMKKEEKEKIFDEFMKRMGKHDPPMRELEHVYYTFDILLDYGAFRDIQRHRICTQTTQELTPENGYEIPKEIIAIGYEKRFKEAMENAKEAFEKIAKYFPKEAQYVLPLAFRTRTLFTMNLREIYHFVKLRSSKEGHASYRKIAWEMYNEVKRIHPILAKYIRVDFSEGPAR